jgi:hypothetical protein
MAGHPLVPAFGAASASLGDLLNRQVELLREAQRDGDPVAAEVLRGTEIVRGDEELPGPELTLETARQAIARDHGYADWDATRGHADTTVDTRFEAAADAIHWGELAELRDLLDQLPLLISMRSPFPHHATLLHHVAANGIEVERQLQSPPNAAEIMRLLLQRGAEPDALCDTYGGGHGATAMCLLVSSCVPAAAGVQASLVHELCRGGAEVDGLDDDGLPLWTAISFGYTEAAEALVRCGARVDNIVFHAALGDLAAVRGYFGVDGRLEPGRARDPLRIGAAGPELPAAHLVEYALIQAAGHGRREVVEFLLSKQPDLAVTEPFFGATARGAAEYLGHPEIAALIAERLPSP